MESKLTNRLVYCMFVIALVVAMTGAAKADRSLMLSCNPLYHGVYVGCPDPVHGRPA